MGPGCFYPGNAISQVGRTPGYRASMGPGCFYPGNGPSAALGSAAGVASMGPGCFYPGNMPGWRCTGIWPACFNGAGMFLSRKYARLALYWDLASVLQWGRDVSIPEICQVGVVLGFGQRASMGPGCFYPGNMPGWRCTGIWPACFNGAGMFL